MTASPVQVSRRMTLGCQQVSTVNSCLVLSPSALRFPGCSFPFTWRKRSWHTSWPVLEPESRLHLLGKVFLIYCLFSNFKSESEVAQSCPTLGDPRDCSLPGSSIHGIFQARVLEWGAIAFSSQRVTLTWLPSSIRPVTFVQKVRVFKTHTYKHTNTEYPRKIR